jgi:hypothetical protein
VTGHLERQRILDLDSLAPAEREEALGHLVRCADCRGVLAADGTERLFSLLATERVPDAVLDRLSASVTAAVAAEEPARPRRLGFAAASVAASLLLAGLLGTYLLKSEVEPPPVPAAVAVAPVPAPAPAQAAPSGVETSSGFELVTPEEAEVVRVRIGDAELVMVFDEALAL